MSTVAQNNIVAGCVHQEGFLMHGHVPVNHSTVPVNQGDLVYWDSAAKIAKPIASDSNVASLLGVALGSSKFNSNIDNSTSIKEPTINIGYGVIANMKTVASDVYNDGDPVYYSTDAQTVTSATGSSNKIGIVRLAPEGSAITGATGVTVPVFVYSQAFVAFKA